MRIWKKMISLFLALCLWTVSPLALASSVGVIGGAESATGLAVDASEVTDEIQLENCFFYALCKLDFLYHRNTLGFKGHCRFLGHCFVLFAILGIF